MNRVLNDLRKDSQAAWRYQAIDHLYEQAIEALEALDCSMDGDDPESCANHLGEAVAAISFLLAAVDVDAGGEAGSFLHGLYSQMLKKLSLVLVSRDREAVRLMGRYLAYLRELWRERVLGTVWVQAHEGEGTLMSVAESG